MNRPRKQMEDFLERLDAFALKVARKNLIATAADARRSIKASLKSGGKNRFSKTYQTSRPGEPPRTHGKRLKQSIRYEIDSEDSVRVGAPSISGARTARVLEEGGESRKTSTRATDAYFERRKRRARSKPVAKSTSGEVSAPVARPQAKRAYYMQSVSGSFRRVTKYERFGSEEKARRALASPGFQRWRGGVQVTKTSAFFVKARPFVAPGVEKETEKERARARWERIYNRLRK